MLGNSICGIQGWEKDKSSPVRVIMRSKGLDVFDAGAEVRFFCPLQNPLPSIFLPIAVYLGFVNRPFSCAGTVAVAGYRTCDSNRLFRGEFEQQPVGVSTKQW